MVLGTESKNGIWFFFVFFQVSARAATLESKLTSLMNQRSELEVKLEAEARRLRSLEEQRSKETANTEALKKSFAEEISELKKEKVRFENKLKLLQISLILTLT